MHGKKGQSSEASDATDAAFFFIGSFTVTCRCWLKMRSEKEDAKFRGVLFLA